MGLKGDVDEFAAKWRGAPWWARLWLGLSAFLAISSIASLAETITKWKGFFKDAITFYHDVLTTPVRDLAATLGWQVLPVRADLLVLHFVFLASMVRYLSALTDWTDRTRRNEVLVLIAMNLLAFAASGYRAINNMDPINWYLVSFSFLVLVAMPRLLKMPKVWLYYTQVLSIFCAVAFLAAINSGLSK